MKKRTKGLRIATVVLSVLLTAAVIICGCSMQTEGARDSDKPPVSPNPKTNSVEAALYFADEQAMFLVPEKREIKYESNIAMSLVQELIKGPESDGLYRTLPPSTRVLSLEVYQEIAYVNLSGDFERDYPGGTTGESIALGSIVQTLTELEEIDAVQFLIEGNKVEVLAKGHVDLSRPLERNVYLGSIEMNREMMEERQKQVENGKDEWLLDPLRTAKQDGPLYRLYVNGQYELIEKIDRGEYSGTGEALVRHSYKDERYEIKLIQPVKQGSGGIWMINSIMPYGTEQEALKRVLENRLLQPNQGGHVFSAYEALGEKEFDGRKTVYLWVLCQEYVQEGEGIVAKSGVSVPVAITLFSQDETHNGVLDYQLPQDGKYYENSIKHIFPEDVQQKISVRQGNVKDLEEINKQAAVEYFE